MKINNQNMNHWMNTQDGSEFLPGMDRAAKPSPCTESGQARPGSEASAVPFSKPVPRPIPMPATQAGMQVPATTADADPSEAENPASVPAASLESPPKIPLGDAEVQLDQLGHNTPTQRLNLTAHPKPDQVDPDAYKRRLPKDLVAKLEKSERLLLWYELDMVAQAKEEARRESLTDEERAEEDRRKLEEYRRSREEEERQKLKERIARAISQSGIPTRFREADVSSCDSALQAYAEGFNPESSGNLVIRGEVGTGKTHGACAILRHLAKRSNVLFATMGGILREIRETYGNDSSESKVIEKYAKTEVLVIDDFGKEKPTEWALQVMFEIIDTRYRENRPTIFTTQYSSGELVERLAETGNVATAKAIVSRMSDCVSVVLDGPDRRLAG